ncbi:hypothetical protein AJ78_07364 [Emergomyces pasteurianus Ep9510]|uniref:Aminoglycoside phosphotransferase domain-containing protein n=1 Tax=Emergomyces pasteurianus Ep9510 TaxID=1447872 RepID=A0A1J9PVQ5_9EURO|nr:hypothetical protein AJ78_07364 [Emergomyces pasteurianus Ep9510]
MWKPVTLPYKSDSSSLPALPTTDEIRACTNILWERQSIKVVAANDEIVVKFGGSIHVWEGQALIYLERYVPKVSAPRLYAMYREVDEQVFLIMQRAPGLSLDKVWPSLTESEKDDIIAKLRQNFDAMRQAECPWPEFFGGFDGGGVHHYLFYNQKETHNYLGPFYGEDAFIAGLFGNF